MAIEFLLNKQNPDGGWPYLHGGSWTEPTVYAVLALLAAGETARWKRGIAWILRTRRNDGGWASRPGVGESSWVTALAALIPEESVGQAAHARAIEWLLTVQGEETTAVFRLRQWLLGNPSSTDRKISGWPWTPGAAAWVGPTAMAVVALESEHQRRPSARVAARVQTGRDFLMAHMCHEGGWNHGSTDAWGYPASPYPETTGMALLAMGRIRSPGMERALSMGRKFLGETRSADAQNWLRLGLAAQGELPQGYAPPAGIAYRTVPEVALSHIAALGGLA
jgi:Prenyltransferase and squalene oxidase repeat